MVQMELIRRLDPFSKDPLFDAVFHGKGRLPIGKDDLMPPFFEFLAQT